MDINALIHRHAESVMIPACRIRHIYLLCFALMAFSFPRQLCAMGDSDEEMQLMTEVALLDEQLKQADCPCDAKIYAHLFQDLEKKPVEKRVKIWRWRLEMAQKLVDAMLSRSSAPSASSGETAAASSPVIKLEPLDCKRKFEEPPYVYPSGYTRKKPKFRYIELPDGSKPLMSPIHVAFAASSVALLRRNPTMIGPELIAEWNKDHAEKWNQDHANNSLPKRGRGASGRADNFFNNGYFLMPQLQGMARGELPLPISNVRQREGPRTGADGAGQVRVYIPIQPHL